MNGENAMKWWDELEKDARIEMEKKHGIYTTEADVEMMYKYEFANTNEPTFTEERDKMIKMVDTLMTEYGKFIELTSSANWRTSGHHCTELRMMKKDLESFSEASERDKEWIQGEKENQKQSYGR